MDRAPGGSDEHSCFSACTLEFLQALKDNNERGSFTANRSRYESLVCVPALRYIEAMREPMARISPVFDVSAKPAGGSLMRVHRDTRFARDKSPYKTNIGIHFRHVRGRDVHVPGFYLHIEPGNASVAGGIYRPEGAALLALQQLIDARPDDWWRVRRSLGRKPALRLGEALLQRAPRGFAADPALAAVLVEFVCDAIDLEFKPHER